jgi:F-type H+-transporting ATPase subunit delta
MKGTIVASRYAKSLLDLSIEKNILDKVNNDMVQLSVICTESTDLISVLNNPTINAVKKLEVFSAIFKGKIESVSLDFIELITKNSRETLLPTIAISFTKLYKEHNNILEIELVSAVVLDDSTKSKIMDKVKAKFDGATIQLSETIDESILGGFIVKIGDKQIDASIASQLTNLKSILLN